MTTEVRMPKLGLTMTEGTVVRWVKQSGDRVEKGETLFEVETDKVVMEVEAPAAGVLREILVPEGETVPVTEVVALVAAAGEAGPTVRATPVARRLARGQDVDLGRLEGTGPRGQITAGDVRGAMGDDKETEKEKEKPQRSTVRASQRARRLADEHGLDVESLAPGRGPKGRIVEKDVLEAIEALDVGRPAERLRPAEHPVTAERETLSRVERVTAQRMAESFSTVPHFYLTVEAGAGQLLELRQALLAAVQRRAGVHLTISDILVKATAVALAEHPRLNGSWEDGRVRLNSAVNVGLAMATQEGLVVPVITQADRKSLPEIAAERAELATRAQEGRLSLDDLARGSFTLTNLGMYGVDQFQPIINPPQSGILAVGQIKRRPVDVDGQLALRPTVFLTLACDHRVLDGARAAAFLQRVTELIEEPYALLAAGALLESGAEREAGAG